MAWIIGSAVVFLLLACLGLGAVGYVASRQAKGSAATGDPAATSTTYPRTSPVHAHTGSLERYVVPVPPGSRKWPDKPEKEELPDLETASGNAPAFKAILSRYEFQRGYAHRWIDSKGTIVDARLFQFQDAENADNFARIMGVSAEAVGWGKATPVPGADGAFVQIQAKRDDYGRIRSKGLVLSDDVVVIVDYFALPPNDPKILDALLTKESQLLH